MNIIDNAAKYGKEGGKIILSMTVDNGSAVVTVTDLGPGIPPEDLPFVKERFYKGQSKMRGTGIGLAVCDEIIKMHGGTRDIESRGGQGTTVTITLPALP